MKCFFSWGIGLATSLLLTACGGGGGGGGSAGIAPNPQTYTSSASAGELISYTIDRNSLTYSYTITKSSYGCELPSAPCHSGSGSLIKNSDGTYSPSTTPSSKIHVLENGLLYGSVTLSINGANLSISNPNCTNTTSGSITSLGSGIFSLRATSPAAGATTNYMVAFRSPNGQKVGFLDFNDATVYGYGQAVISDVVSVVGSDVAGTYVATSIYGGTGTVTVNANQTTSSGQTVTYNQPWTGMATVTGGSNGTGYALLAGNGVYVYRNPTIPNASAYYEIGLRLN